MSSSTPAFAPADRPDVTVAADGTLAAIQEPTRISIVEIPSCAPFAELGTDAKATASEVAWVGTPPRLLVLSRFEGSHSVVHLVDPLGPRAVTEIRLESPMRLVASAGAFALAVGASSAAILATTDKSLTPYQFPARAVPVAAGAAGTNFVVALPGAIEEWDPQTRMPKRRLKLPRPATITALGGSERVVWMTTQQEPARIDVIAFVNRGQPKAHDLPEPIAAVASHPRSDIVACIGATSGRIYVVDLDGRMGLRVIGPSGIDRTEAIGLVLGRVAGVLAAQAQKAVTVVTLERPDAAEQGSGAPAAGSLFASRTSSLFGSPDDAETPTAVSLATPPAEPARAPRPASPPPIANPMPAAAARGTTPPAVSKLQPPPGAVSKLQPPAGVSAARATPPTPDKPSSDKSSSEAALFSTSASPPSRPSASGLARTEAPPTRASAAGLAQTEAPPIRASASSLAAPEHTGPLPPARDARAIDDTVPPPSFTMPPPSSAGAALATSGAPLSPMPARGSDPRRGVAETIPVANTDERKDHFKSFRERVEHPRARTAEPVATLWPDASPTWREDLIGWAGAIEAGETADYPSTPIDTLALRYDLSSNVIRSLAWLYAQHLRGLDGAAPVDLARLAGGDWSEALGRGELADKSLATYRDSRVRLVSPVQRVLDDLAPLTGTLVGTAGPVSLLGPCVIVASGPLTIIAEACVPSIGGAILAAHPGADLVELAIEARGYGAAPMWRVRTEQLERLPLDQPIILVADDDVTAEQLGVPRLT